MKGKEGQKKGRHLQKVFPETPKAAPTLPYDTRIIILEERGGVTQRGQ